MMISLGIVAVLLAAPVAIAKVTQAVVSPRSNYTDYAHVVWIDGEPVISGKNKKFGYPDEPSGSGGSGRSSGTPFGHYVTRAVWRNHPWRG